MLKSDFPLCVCACVPAYVRNGMLAIQAIVLHWFMLKIKLLHY